MFLEIWFIEKQLWSCPNKYFLFCLHFKNSHHRITTFQSTMDCIYDCGPVRLWLWSRKIITTQSSPFAGVQHFCHCSKSPSKAPVSSFGYVLKPYWNGCSRLPPSCSFYFSMFQSISARVKSEVWHEFI